jgi:single-strand DNA-binding protein
MGLSVNKVELIGNLGRDPEMRTTQTGKIIATLNIATSESWKDQRSGEWVERTEWHRVVIFNEALAKIAEKHLEQGMKVRIEGKLRTRKWQDPGGGRPLQHRGSSRKLRRRPAFRHEKGRGPGGWRRCHRWSVSAGARGRCSG